MLGMRDPDQNKGQSLPFTNEDLSNTAMVIFAKIPPKQFFEELDKVYGELKSDSEKRKFLVNAEYFVKELLRKDVKHQFHEEIVTGTLAFVAKHQLPVEFSQSIKQTALQVIAEKARQDAIIAMPLSNGQSNLNDVVNVSLNQNPSEVHFDDPVAAMVHDLRQIQLAQYRTLSPTDFHNRKWDKDKEQKLAISQMIKNFDGLGVMVVSDIVLAAQNKDHQKSIFAFYTKVAAKCIETGDLQSAAAIFGSLNHSAVRRFKYLVDEQPEIAQLTKELDVIFSPTKSNKGLRDTLAAKKAEGLEVIPWVGIPMQDMFITEETATAKESEDKLQNLSNAMKIIFDAQSSVAFSHNPEPLATNLAERIKQHEALNTEDAKAKQRVFNARTLEILPRGESEPRAAYFSNPKASALAKELTDRHGALMMKVDPQEVKKWVKTPEQAPNFVALINDLQNLENMVRDDIMMATSESAQAEQYEFYVQLLVECEHGKNYAAMRAISAGLNSEPVSRLQYLQSVPAFERFQALTDHENGLLSNKGDKAKMKARMASEEGFCIPDISITKFKVEIAGNYEGEGKSEREKAALDEFKSWQDRTGMNYEVNSPMPQSSLDERYQQLPLDSDFAVQRSHQIYKPNGIPFENAPATLAGIILENESVVLNKLFETVRDSNKSIELIVNKSTPDKPFWHEDSGRRLEQVKSALDKARKLQASTTDEKLKVHATKSIQKLEANLNKLEELKVNTLRPLMQEIREQFDGIAYLASGDIEISDIKGYQEPSAKFNALIEKLVNTNLSHVPEISALLNEATTLKINLDSMMSAVTSLPLMKEIKEQFDGINYMAQGLMEQSSLEGYKETRDSFNSLIEKLQSDNPNPHPQVAALLQEAIAVRDNFDKNVAAVMALQAASPSQPASSPVAQVAAPSQPESSPVTQVDLNDKGKEELYPFPEPSQPASSPDKLKPPETSNLIDEVYDILEKAGEIAKMKASVKAKIELLVNDIKTHLAPNKVFELIGPQVRANENGRAFLAFRLDKEPRAQSFCEALRAMGVDCTAPKDLKDKGVQVITMDANQLLAILKDKNGASLLKGNYERIMDEKGAKNLLSPRATQPQPKPKPQVSSAPSSPLSLAQTKPPITLPKAGVLQAAVAKKQEQARSERTNNALDLTGGSQTLLINGSRFKAGRFTGEKQDAPKRTAQEIAQTYLTPNQGNSQTPGAKKTSEIPQGVVSERMKAFQRPK